MNKTNIYNENVLTAKVKINPRMLNKNYQKYIFNNLKNSLEGSFSKFGLIKKDSIELIKISLGKLEQHSFEGNILYNVQFKALICNPVIGNIILCKVVNTNNFGILCSSSENNVTVIEVIIPKKSIAIQSDINLNNIKINDDVYVEIMGKKPQLNDTKIKCIGKIIKISGKKIQNLENVIETDENIIIEKDVDYEEPIQSGGEISDDELSEHDDSSYASENELSGGEYENDSIISDNESVIDELSDSDGASDNGIEVINT